MRLTIKTMDMACLTGLLVLALGGSVVAVMAVRVRTGQVDRRSQTVAARVSELKQAQSVLETLNRVLESNQAALEALQKRLPAAQDIGKFLTGLDDMMARNKVELRQVTPATPVREELCTRTPLSFSCRGPFEGLHAVLFELERMDRLVRVDQLAITRPDLTAPCDMNVSCSVYGR